MSSPLDLSFYDVDVAVEDLFDALEVRACRGCGCTDDHACPGGCWWIEADLCSTCGAGQPGDLVQEPPC